ncbi:MAG TPA: acyltransferase [Pyrinomonadaceae bacterium]|nr:acyltransferase [Pyrinomonadaceae bacterium]
MPQLDSLRAFAIGAVLVHHFLPVDKIIPTDFITLGLIGVRLFFVLSGFLITGILLRARGQEYALRRFYYRRILRIFPIYYLTLIIIFVVSARLRNDAGWLATYTTNFITPFRSLEPAGHFWTLAVEEQFYLVWPFLMLLVPARHLLKIIVGSVVLAVLFRFVTVRVFHEALAAGVWTFGCLDSLGLGGLLAFFSHDARLSIHRERFLRWSIALGSLITVGLTFLYIRNVGTSLIAAFLCLGLSLIFMAIIARAADGMQGRMKLILEATPLIYIGRISYGLYVYHNFMPGIVQLFYRSTGDRRGTVLAAIAATALTFLAAMVSWHLIEKPISRLKQSFRDDGQEARLSSVEAQ